MALTLFGTPNALTVHDLSIAPCSKRDLLLGLVAQWHSTLPFPAPLWRVSFLVYAPNLAPVAVAMWNHPTSNNEDQLETLELIRQAHGPDAPRNTGTWMLGQMRRWIRQNMPEITRLISYQDADVHHGTIYKADNWTMIGETFTVTPWNKARPDRRAGTERQHKIKWERTP